MGIEEGSGGDVTGVGQTEGADTAREKLPVHLHGLHDDLKRADGGTMSPESATLLSHAKQGQLPAPVVSSVDDKGEAYHSILLSFRTDLERVVKDGEKAGASTDEWVWEHAPKLLTALTLLFH